MNNNQLNRALKIVKKTGDKFLIMDKDSDEVFALMDLDSYEDLAVDFEDFEPDYDPNFDPFAGIPDEEVNDFSGWQNEPTDFEPEDLNSIDFKKEEEDIDEANDKENNNPFAIPEERFEASENKQQDKEDDKIRTVPVKSSGDWSSVGNIISEEALDDLPEDEVEDDDKFYLEPVE